MRYLRISILILMLFGTNRLFATEEPTFFQTLGIKNTALLSEGKYFGVPQTVWGFSEPRGFSYLLKQLETKKLPFQQVDILAHQLLLSGEWEGKAVQLWLKRHQEDAFSGALTLWEASQSLPSLSSIEALPIETQVLFDMSMDQPEKMRHWIYLLPFTVREAQQWLTRSLSEQQWQRLSFDGAFMVWQKKDEQLHYHVTEVEEKAALYVLKKQLTP